MYYNFLSFFLFTDSSSRNSIISIAKPIAELSLKKDSDDGVSEDEWPLAAKQHEKTEEENSEKETQIDNGTKYLKGRKFLHSIKNISALYLRTSAERKEYSSPKTEVKEEPKTFRSQQVSVIQRTPSISNSSSPSEESTEKVITFEPEQEAPIDYHIPKKRSDLDDEIKPKYLMPSRKQQILYLNHKFPKNPNILMAAAGHSRNNGGGGNCGGNSQNANTNGTNRNSSTGHNNYNGNGVNVFNGGYNGAVNGGSDRPGDGSVNSNGANKCGYEPGGALPPFGESLKSTHLVGFQNPMCEAPYSSLPTDQVGMEYDTGQSDGMPLNGFFLGVDLSKQYAMLHNTYGLTMKDDDDVTNYLRDNPNFLNYDDSSFMDAVVTNSVDSLQFPATLTFSTPTDNPAILDQLPESPDLFIREVKVIVLHLIKEYFPLVSLVRTILVNYFKLKYSFHSFCSIYTYS